MFIEDGGYLSRCKTCSIGGAYATCEASCATILNKPLIPNTFFLKISLLKPTLFNLSKIKN
jgi:hypothetical protein